MVFVGLKICKLFTVSLEPTLSHFMWSITHYPIGIFHDHGLPLYFKELEMKIMYYIYYFSCSRALGFLLTSFLFSLKNLL